MTVGVTLFIFLLVLQSCVSQTSNATTVSTNQNTASPVKTVTVGYSTNAISSSAPGERNTTTVTTRTAATTSKVITSTTWTTTNATKTTEKTNLTHTLSTQTERTSTRLPITHYSSIVSMPVYTRNMINITNGTNSSNETTTPTTMRTTTTTGQVGHTSAPTHGYQTVISSTTIPTSISTENYTISQSATETVNRMTLLSSIFSESSNLNNNVSTTITSSTTLSKVTSPVATKDPTNETQRDKGNEKEIKNELGYDRDLVIIFGTMLSLMLVASISYGIFKYKRRQKSRQFMEGGGSIHIATSKF